MAKKVGKKSKAKLKVIKGAHNSFGKSMKGTGKCM